MATYVNDLRLKEIATGDESGTWGTSTNTNLELIGEALGYGTEGITTNADTHTTTVADGATDPGRAMYIEYTGTLDSTCTITIAPNTLNRVHIIENGTSGSQSIIIKQGSGATVTIPTGATKMVYLDGAGSGAKVTDALASLNLETSKVIETSASIQTPLIEFTDGDDAITISDGGGTSFAQKITADAGIDIDNFNIDGTTIALSSGDLTLDVAGDIVLDADGEQVNFSHATTLVGQVDMGSNNFTLRSKVSNADFSIHGTDDGANVVALTLDMSDAGRAIFPTGMVIHDATALANTTFDARDVDNVTSLNVQNNGATIQRSQSATAAPTLVFNKARGSLGSESNTADGDFAGSITFRGYHTNGFYQCATIEAKIVQAGGTTDMPGTLIFSTSSDGGVTPISRMELNHTGQMTLKNGITTGQQILAMNNSFATVADNSSVTVGGIRNTGALLSVGAFKNGTGIIFQTALFFGSYGNVAISKLSDPHNGFGVSAGTDGIVNVRKDGNADIVIENKTGGENRITATIIASQGL